jgi:hypothetical protein
MKSCQPFPLVVALVLTLPTLLCAENSNRAFFRLPHGYQWVAEAKKRGLGTADIEKLRRQKILIGSESYRQIHVPYDSTKVPLFITSDSVLSVYAVLFEASISRLEAANARTLPGILRALWMGLAGTERRVHGKPELVAAGRLRAQIVIGVALKLLGDDMIQPDRKVGAIVREEVARIRQATARDKPKWLGQPDERFLGLDYSRYKPRGFYTRSPELRRYFRAVSWLQSIPFRVARDDELLAMVLLGQNRLRQEQAEFFRCYRQFVGEVDDWDLLTAQSLLASDDKLDLTGNGLSEFRRRLTDKAARSDDGPQINDQFRFPPLDPSQTAEPNFRIVSAYRLPDAILFHRTTDIRVFKPRWPTGLEVCAALGSSFAGSRIGGDEKEKLLKTIKEARGLFAGTSLYAEYLKCLACLLAEPEPDAPAFMTGEPWRIKSCNTALAGWAQARHTWVLQAKETRIYGAVPALPAGFVEPVPEFYGAMADLVEKTIKLLDSRHALAYDPRAAVQDIRAVAILLAKKATNKEISSRHFSPEEVDLFWKVLEVMSTLDDGVHAREGKYTIPRKLSEKLHRLADELEAGKWPGDKDLRRALEHVEEDLRPRWQRFKTLVQKLEPLAHKQLRCVPFTSRDNRVIEHYGGNLDWIMFQNKYDDAPRVTDVFSDADGSRFLEVAVGRPRVLYVLYPLKGGEILCRGAVLVYHEFQHPERLNDAAWKKLLDSAKCPPAPSWLKPIVTADRAKLPRSEE